MGKRMIVEGDPVQGEDVHEVSGWDTQTAPNGPQLYNGTARYKYKDAISETLCDFITINGFALALINSGSRLIIGSGGHVPVLGESFNPAAPPPDKATLQFKKAGAIGPGTPSAGAGSRFVRVGGQAVLLDGDKIDTCDDTGATGNSSVSASGQSFVTCSE